MVDCLMKSMMYWKTSTFQFCDAKDVVSEVPGDLVEYLRGLVA